MAEGGRDTWMKCDALEYYECQGDDLAVQEMGGVKNDGTVWFSFIVFRSKEHRE